MEFVVKIIIYKWRYSDMKYCKNYRIYFKIKTLAMFVSDVALLLRAIIWHSWGHKANINLTHLHNHLYNYNNYHHHSENDSFLWTLISFLSPELCHLSWSINFPYRFKRGRRRDPSSLFYLPRQRTTLYIGWGRTTEIEFMITIYNFPLTRLNKIKLVPSPGSFALRS